MDFIVNHTNMVVEKDFSATEIIYTMACKHQIGNAYNEGFI